MENRFNLIDEAWLPITDVGRVSLRQVFTQPEYCALGGNPVQKIAILKFLQAIAQAAATPANLAEWQATGWQGVAERVCGYLDRWHDRFYLYGPQPFLQMPAIARAAIKLFGAVLPEVSTGNTTVLTQSQTEKPLDDADKALLLLGQMSFALGGKKTDNSVVLTEGYRGKTKDNGKGLSGKPGPGIAFKGLLHNFFLGTTLQKTVWLNLFTHEDIAGLAIYPSGLGIPPWEQMPEGEDCATAKALKSSLMGRLIPLCRFCLLTDNGLHYSEGIAHANYKENVFDPSVAIDVSGKEPKVRWADPERRPWRELTGLLSFISHESRQLDCYQLRIAQDKARHQTESVAVWSGGLRVSSNAGEQYVTGLDDVVESVCWLQPELWGEIWFSRFKAEMNELDKLAKTLYGCVMSYYKTLLVEGANYAAQATHLFWQLSERQAQPLLEGCDDPEICQQLRRQFVDYALQIFNQRCPHHTARQLEAWVKARPDFALYLKQEKE